MTRTFHCHTWWRPSSNWTQVKINTVTINRENTMFLTIGLIIGFAAGWYVNEKFEDLGEIASKLKFWKK